MKFEAPPKPNYLNKRLVGILRTKVGTPAINAIKAIEVALDLGAEAVEITSNSDYWQQVVKESVKRSLSIGVGSIKDSKTAEEAIGLGASFLVSPGLFEDVVAFACEQKVPVLGGVYTKNEAVLARELGAVDIKFFPCGVGTHEELFNAIKEPFRDEFDELQKKGHLIISYASYNEVGFTPIRVSSPTEFYKQYVSARDERSNLHIVIGLPSGKVGLDRLQEVANLGLTFGIRTYAVGGVNDKNIKEVLTRRGAYGVCIGSGMFDTDAVLQGDFDKVKADVKKYVALLREIVTT